MNESQYYKEQAKKVWGNNPAGWVHAQDIKTDTQQFFETVLQKRLTRECAWLDGIVNFNQFKNKKVLEIGSGAGYDAYEFLKNGADYTGIDVTPQNIILSKKHLSFYGYNPRIVEMDAEQLDFGDETFDFIFSFGVIHHIYNIEKVLKNIHKHLANDGTAQLIVYHKRSIFYWVRLYLYNWFWLGDRKKYGSFEDRLAAIETTGTNERALVRVYTKKEIHELLELQGFSILKTDVRKLTPEDFPCSEYFGKVFNFLPNFIKTFLEVRFGWYLSVVVKKV